MSKQREDIPARYARLKRLHVGILVFPGVEVLDFAGPFRVFSVASRVCKREPGHAPEPSRQYRWEDNDDLRAQFPQLEVKEKLPFIDTGRVVTSAGISAGIGMSLHLVQRVLGAGMAAATARQMEYDWAPSASTP